MKIETRRLILRKHKLEDFKRFWDMINDPEAKKYTGGVTHLEYSERLKLFKEECDIPFSDEAIEFAVIDKKSGKYLGYCGFRNSIELKEKEFLYGYCQDCWGHGYGFEAAEVVLQYLFKTLCHDSYVATVHPDNIASARILKKLGFKKKKTIIVEDNEKVDYYVIRKCIFLFRR